MINFLNIVYSLLRKHNTTSMRSLKVSRKNVNYLYDCHVIITYVKALDLSEITIVVDDQSRSYSLPIYGHCMTARVFDFSGKANILLVFSDMAST